MEELEDIKNIHELLDKCDKLEKALDKACNLLAEAVRQDCLIFNGVLADDYIWRTERECWKGWLMKDE